VPFGDVDVDADPRLRRAGAEGDALAFQEERELARRVVRGALVEGTRHDRRDALRVARLPGQRQRNRDAYRVDVLTRHVVDDDVEAVRQRAPPRLREGVRLGRIDVGPRGLNHDRRVHAAASCSSTR
jgi:hypothetical protein